ncbi:MAG TPA: amino acid permease, partial [Verrucomicrobiae bacterium]|nr:amino acid permease [Verrucomicrobiae bacterium]
WSGVMRAAGLLFFAYVGFDQVSSCAQEAKNPQRDIPIALLLSLIVCAVLYISMSVVMTGLAPYQDLNVPNPVFVAIDHTDASLAWLKPLVAVGVVVGLFAAVLMCIYGQTRIFYAMARDGLFPKAFAAVDPRRALPVASTIFTGLVAAAIAGLTPLQLLGELISIGTLLAFAIVCAGVLVLRVRKPDTERKFRAPMVWLFAPIGCASCLFLMLSLPAETWARFWVWLALGGLGYLVILAARRNAARRARLA